MTRAAFLLSLVALALPLAAKTPETTLTIKVTDLKGNPVDRASVIIRFVSGHSMVKMGKANRTQYELRTNQEGVAKFPPITQGRIRVQIIAARYQTYGDMIDVSEDEKTLDIKLNPPQTQYSAHE
jgi:uncharacterized GH25 family protein